MRMKPAATAPVHPNSLALRGLSPMRVVTPPELGNSINDGLAINPVRPSLAPITSNFSLLRLLRK